MRRWRWNSINRPKQQFFTNIFIAQSQLCSKYLSSFFHYSSSAIEERMVSDAESVKPSSDNSSDVWNFCTPLQLSPITITSSLSSFGLVKVPANRTIGLSPPTFIYISEIFFWNLTFVQKLFHLHPTIWVL